MCWTANYRATLLASKWPSTGTNSLTPQKMFQIHLFYIILIILWTKLQPSLPQKSVCVCAVNISFGRALLCKYYKVDSEDYFYMSRRDIVKEIDDCAKITTLEITRSPQILNLKANTMLPMINLTNLIIQTVNIRNPINPEFFRGMKKLEVLEIIGPHRIKEISEHNFQYIAVTLKRLVLRDNGIQMIRQYAFCDLKELEYLDLSKNRLRIFSCDWFTGLFRTSFVNLTEITPAYYAYDVDVPDCLLCPLRNLQALSYSTEEERIPQLVAAIGKTVSLTDVAVGSFAVVGFKDDSCQCKNQIVCSWTSCTRYINGVPDEAVFVTKGPTTNNWTTTTTSSITPQYASTIHTKPTESKKEDVAIRRYDNENKISMPPIILTTTVDPLQTVSPATPYNSSFNNNSSISSSWSNFIESEMFIILITVILIVFGTIILAGIVAFLFQRRPLSGRYNVKEANGNTYVAATTV